MEFVYNPISHESRFNLANVYERRLDLGTKINSRFLLKRRQLKDHHWDLSGNEVGTMAAALFEGRDRHFELQWGAIFKRVDLHRSALLQELFGEHDTVISKVPDTVGVHYRLGDTAYPLDINYYVTAVRRIGASSVTVFTDGDRAVVERLFMAALPDVSLRVADGDAVEDLLELASCASIVMSFSWFSYWAAFISHDARVIAPREFCYYPHWEMLG